MWERVAQLDGREGVGQGIGVRSGGGGGGDCGGGDAGGSGDGGDGGGDCGGGAPSDAGDGIRRQEGKRKKKRWRKETRNVRKRIAKGA